MAIREHCKGLCSQYSGGRVWFTVSSNLLSYMYLQQYVVDVFVVTWMSYSAGEIIF